MIILSIDTETTGLDLEKCSLLQFSAIIEDTNNVKPLEELPHFTCYVDTGSMITGSMFALNMNRNIIEILSKLEVLKGEELKQYRIDNKILNEDEITESLYYFLQINNVINTFDEGGHVKNHIDLNGESRMVNVFTNKSKRVHLNVLGKNFSTFDKIFMERMPRWKQIFSIRRRIADPAILYTNWKEDNNLPNFQTCMDRSNLEGNVVHDAYYDAKDTLHMLRKATDNYTKIFY